MNIIIRSGCSISHIYLCYGKGSTVDLVIKFHEFKIHGNIRMANGRSQKLIYVILKVISLDDS